MVQITNILYAYHLLFTIFNCPLSGIMILSIITTLSQCLYINALLVPSTISYDKN